MLLVIKQVPGASESLLFVAKCLCIYLCNCLGSLYSCSVTC